MSDNWIKMRIRLREDPHVVRIVSRFQRDDCHDPVPLGLAVVGALHAVWSVFDEQSCDGKLLGYTPEAMDECIGWPGFSEAMIDVGWLSLKGKVLEMHNFVSHNGQSAKRRIKDAERQRAHRENVTISSRNGHTKSVTREDKRREEKIKSKSASSNNCERHPNSGLTNVGTCFGCYSEKYAAKG